MRREEMTPGLRRSEQYETHRQPGESNATDDRGKHPRNVVLGRLCPEACDRYRGSAYHRGRAGHVPLVSMAHMFGTGSLFRV